jgi:hypothetical protein
MRLPSVSPDFSGTNMVETGPSFLDWAQKAEKRTKSRPRRHHQNPAVFVFFTNNNSRTNERLSSKLGHPQHGGKVSQGGGLVIQSGGTFQSQGKQEENTAALGILKLMV